MTVQAATPSSCRRTTNSASPDYARRELSTYRSYLIHSPPPTTSQHPQSHSTSHLIANPALNRRCQNILHGTLTHDKRMFTSAHKRHMPLLSAARTCSSRNIHMHATSVVGVTRPIHSTCIAKFVNSMHPNPTFPRAGRSTAHYQPSGKQQPSGIAAE